MKQPGMAAENFSREDLAGGVGKVDEKMDQIEFELKKKELETFREELDSQMEELKQEIMDVCPDLDLA